MSITRREKIVKVIQEETIILELTPEQAAVISILVYQSGGHPTGVRGYADEIMRKLSNAGCVGYDIRDPAYAALTADVNAIWSSDSKTNSFFLKVVEKFRNIRIS